MCTLIENDHKKCGNGRSTAAVRKKLLPLKIGINVIIDKSTFNQHKKDNRSTNSSATRNDEKVVHS